MNKEEKVKSKEGIDISKKDNCDRCGNDLSKGVWYLHFPFIKIYIALCHICYQGTAYGFYNDIKREIHEIHQITFKENKS